MDRGREEKELSDEHAKGKGVGILLLPGGGERHQRAADYLPIAWYERKFRWTGPHRSLRGGRVNFQKKKACGRGEVESQKRDLRTFRGWNWVRLLFFIPEGSNGKDSLWGFLDSWRKEGKDSSKDREKIK